MATLIYHYLTVSRYSSIQDFVSCLLSFKQIFFRQVNCCMITVLFKQLQAIICYLMIHYKYHYHHHHQYRNQYHHHLFNYFPRVQVNKKVDIDMDPIQLIVHHLKLSFVVQHHGDGLLFSDHFVFISLPMV